MNTNFILCQGLIKSFPPSLNVLLLFSNYVGVIKVIVLTALHNHYTIKNFTSEKLV